MSTTAAQAMNARGTSWRTIGIGLLLALGPISLPFGRWDGALTSVSRNAANELVFLALIAAVVGYVRWVEQRPLSSIGLGRPSLKDLLLAVATGILIVATLAAMYLVVFPALHWSENQQIGTLLALPFWLRLVSVARAAVSEELLFRGYALERVQTLTRSPAAAGTFTWAVFTLDHLGYWGWHHLLVAGVAGAMLTLLYLWRRNLWANILAHFIVDAVAFLGG